jgi:hypothetical protein
LDSGLVSRFERRLAWIEALIHTTKGGSRMDLLQLIPLALVIGVLAGVTHSGGEP